MALSAGNPRATRLPGDVVARMERFGRFEFDPAATGIDATDVWGELQEPFLPFAESDPGGFARELANAVLPAGGFALFGAARTMWNLIGSDFDDPAYRSVRTAALEFFRANGVPAGRLPTDDWLFWRKNHSEPWLAGSPPPAPGEARITPLAPGELRRVAQITEMPDSNVVHVGTADDGRFVAVVDAPASDTDPTRSRFVWMSADTLHALYTGMGEVFQTPVHWAAEELRPFIPLPPSRF
ncbi:MULTISPECIES: hypothetical protein [unclassified Streptomyces]|uniref:hypothetical protein n=1 Tax=unclassified Streptomyces TaxID=2593676 RepID=UPI000978D679|nr:MULTISPECIES: hypothetical protein [unclassified Streptomyces]ONI48738.1 hypothetical protein STIB_71120 [Streptomyces sp. IB2014 011-1]RDV47772.1 hypothetical protein DDV98_32255 [Streptomyces sp. IB2014 011-12]